MHGRQKEDPSDICWLTTCKNFCIRPWKNFLPTRCVPNLEPPSFRALLCSEVQHLNDDNYLSITSHFPFWHQAYIFISETIFVYPRQASQHGRNNNFTISPCHVFNTRGPSKEKSNHFRQSKCTNLYSDIVNFNVLLWKC